MSTDDRGRELAERLARVQGALVREQAKITSSWARAAFDRVLNVLDQEARRPFAAPAETETIPTTSSASVAAASSAATCTNLAAAPAETEAGDRPLCVNGERDAGPWEHDDGSTCDVFLSSRPFPGGLDSAWWCTEHQQHLHPAASPPEGEGEGEGEGGNGLVTSAGRPVELWWHPYAGVMNAGTGANVGSYFTLGAGEGALTRLDGLPVGSVRLLAASPPSSASEGQGEAGEARTTLGEPETRFGWHDEDYQGHNPAVGWDLAFGCQVSIGYDDGTLRAVVAMSDASGRGHEVRTVTEEQVRAYASQLLALVTPALGEGQGATEGAGGER